MTEEEIKQNALAYAKENYGEYDEHDYTDHSGSNMCHAVSEKAFIAGAHSRDEEIKRLYNRLADFRYVINNLCHPWISIDIRLPKEENNPDKYNAPHRARSSRNVIITDGTIINRGYYSYARKRWEWNEGEIKVTHWMPIPKI